MDPNSRQLVDSRAVKTNYGLMTKIQVKFVKVNTALDERRNLGSWRFLVISIEIWCMPKAIIPCGSMKVLHI